MGAWVRPNALPVNRGPLRATVFHKGCAVGQPLVNLHNFPHVQRGVVVELCRGMFRALSLLQVPSNDRAAADQGGCEQLRGQTCAEQSRDSRCRHPQR